MTNGCMASAVFASSTSVVSAPSSACPSKKTSAARFRRRTLSCRASAGGGRGDNNDGPLSLPRRDMMLSGLSGVAAGLALYPGFASGAEATKCALADKVTDKTILCTDKTLPCPPVPEKPTDPIEFTPASKVTRVRKPVHLLSREEQEKYKEAVGKMKALDESDPTNPLRFAAQAAIHEAYCDAHYKYLKSLGAAADDKDPTFDVHFSWLFAPWHRMYLYFYERALGDLIGDDTFALPFWSWDKPAGMVVPPLFKDSVGNPLYDANRNPLTQDALLDLDYLHNTGAPLIPFKGPQDDKYKELVNKNLSTVYNQQVGQNAESFLGEKYCTGGSSGGSLERMVHTAMHVWVGKAGPPAGKDCNAETGVPSHVDGKFSCKNDMGFLGSAGRDPLFYSHHSNVDRMWHLWSTRLGGGEGFTESPDWLDAAFVFYDNVKAPQKVRIKFSDVLDTRNLGYVFDRKYDRDLPWLRPKTASLVPHGKDAPAKAKSKDKAPSFPLALAKNQVVDLTDVAVPAKEPGKEVVLVIEGIEFDPQANNKFDVAINVPKDKASQVGPQHKEYAGTFTSVPGTGGGKTRQAKLSLCITNTLNDIDAEDDKTVDVVIVPRSDAKITINAPPTIQNRN